MPQVTVADVDNLIEVTESLSKSYCVATDKYRSDSAEMTTICETAKSDLSDACRELEVASQQVDGVEQELNLLQEDLSCAENKLDETQCNLNSALEDLSVAQEAGYYDEDGNWVHADTSNEEAAVAIAQKEVEAVQAVVKKIQDQILKTKARLEQFRAKREQCVKRYDFAKETSIQAEFQRDSFVSIQQMHLDAIEHQINIANSRLSHAKEALDQYLATNHVASQFEKWIHWPLVNNQVITPRDIHDRLNFSPEMQKQFGEYLYLRDVAYRARIDNYRLLYANAKGEAEKHSVLIQASRGGSGEYAEKLLLYALRPLGNISSQHRTYFDNGRYTKTDLVVSELTNPVIIGKGSGMSAPRNGSIAIEVKTGSSAYLYSQKDHMSFQAEGHQGASASMTVCSRDIKFLSPEKEQELRDALRHAGSPIIGMLPSKEEIDGEVWREICQG